MSEDKPKKKESEKDERFYEPRNWDKKMRIEDQSGSSTNYYCGRCGYNIYEGDSFCTKCGAKSRTQEN